MSLFIASSSLIEARYYKAIQQFGFKNSRDGLEPKGVPGKYLRTLLTASEKGFPEAKPFLSMKVESTLKRSMFEQTLCHIEDLERSF
jgi:hypothetical protein